MIVEVILGIVFLLLLWKMLKKPSNYPPGLWGLPGFGYLPIGIKDHIEFLSELRKRHGDVILWRIGSRLMVFLYNFENIKEVLSRQDFADRPRLQIHGIFHKDKDVNENTGLIASNGDHWKKNRRFTARMLKDYGMGKSRMMSAIHEEADCLIEEMKKRGNKPSPLPHYLNIAVLNIIWQMIASKRFEMDDPEMVKIINLLTDFQANMARISIGDFFTFFEKITPRFIWKRLTKYDQVQELKEKFYSFFLNFVNSHKVSLNPDDPRDYIDSYLIEMEKQKSNPESSMSERDLIVCLTDLFDAGGDTIGINLRWIMLYLANYPEVQKKLQKTVDEEMPKGSLPMFEDKMRLSYVEAFINEVHRHRAFIPTGFMHAAAHDTHIGKYFVPKGTFLHYMIDDCHHDSSYWTNPQEFNPDRFLDEEGKFNGKHSSFLPFGIGKRSCIGESMGQAQLLIFTTAFVQHFNFAPPPGKKIDMSPMPENPFFRFPRIDQDIVIAPRT